MGEQVGRTNRSVDLFTKKLAFGAAVAQALRSSALARPRVGHQLISTP
jgi:hypothetical protein